MYQLVWAMKRIMLKIQTVARNESLIVAGIITVLVAILLLSIGGVAANSKTEAADMEHNNVQTAVIAMLVDAGVRSLSEAGCDVDDLEEVKGIKAKGTDGTEYSLDQYLTGINYPLLQPYSITKDGVVTVNSECIQ